MITYKSPELLGLNSRQMYKIRFADCSDKPRLQALPVATTLCVNSQGTSMAESLESSKIREPGEPPLVGLPEL